MDHFDSDNRKGFGVLLRGLGGGFVTNVPSSPSVMKTVTKRKTERQSVRHTGIYVSRIFGIKRG